MPLITRLNLRVLFGAALAAAFFVASVAPSYAQSITPTYTAVGSAEVITAPFASSSGTTTINAYSGPVEVQVSGTGNALFSNTSDAFYFIGSQTETSPSNGDFELAVGTPAHPLVGEADGDGGMTDAVKYDIVFISGVGAVSPGTIPAYSNTNTYDFVINVPNPTATVLTFGVNDGAYYDNSGSYTITLTQLAVGSGSVQFSAASTLATEAVGSVTLSVSRTGGSGAVSVNYATADDTALAGTDYQAASGTLSWANGDTTPKTITVPILNRNLTSGSTLFLVNLSAPAGGATLASPTQAAVTILDTPSTANLQAVSLLSPPAGVTLTAGQPVVLQADAEALSGTLANVEFFAVDSSGNSTDLGGTASARGQVTWTPAAAGSFTLQVVATDSGGNTMQATSAVTVVAAGAALPQTSLQAGLDGITVPLNTTVPVVAQAVDSAGNALANVQFYLDGVLVPSAPVAAIRQENARAADAGASTLYGANVLMSKITQLLTVVGTTSGGVSSVSTAATIYGKAEAGAPPTATISNLASGATVSTAAGQSVTVTASSGSQALAKVELVVDNQNVGTATTVPFTFNLPALAASSHAMSVIATDIGALSSVSAPVLFTAEQTATQSAAFFTGQVALANGVYYLAFPSGNFFGYYSFLANPSYLYHFDLGFEYVFDAADGHSGVYLYDFASSTFFYTSPTFPFPYLYDFSLNSVLYYYPDPNNAGHYNTNGVRYFYDFNTGTIITK